MRALVTVFLLVTAATSQAQEQEREVLIRGKSLDAWIKQSQNGPTLGDRHNALQVLRNDGLRLGREETLKAFTEALSDENPTVQSLAAAGVAKAGIPTNPKALSKLVEIISEDLSGANPNTDEFGRAARAVNALEEVGGVEQIPGAEKGCRGRSHTCVNTPILHQKQFVESNIARRKTLLTEEM